MGNTSADTLTRTQEAGDAQRDNPYVGPIAFPPGVPLYGRERETRDLCDLLLRERLVVLHSRSGAGKTSLLHTRIRAEMEAEGYEVLPFIRVGLQPSAGAEPPQNRYLRSAIGSFRGDPGANDFVPPPGKDIFRRFLEHREAALRSLSKDFVPRPYLFVFDQFEEIFTLDPTDVREKREFFSALGALLATPRCSVLIALREEWLANLDEFAHAVPTGFGVRYRLQLLSHDAAREAIKRPAADAGVPFHPAAAEKLVEDLSRVIVQMPDGETRWRNGLFVEPLQLQVVCVSLWEEWQGLREKGELSVDAEEPAITLQDVERLARIERALGSYYAEKIASVAESTGVQEQLIRDWITDKLITPRGLRNQVRYEQGSETAGLPNRAVGGLIDALVIRKDVRGKDDEWLELVHDRLLDAIRVDNDRWLRTNATLLRQAAEAWVTSGRERANLLDRRAMEREKARAAAELSTVEREFLQACEQANAEEDLRRARRKYVVATGFSLFMAAVVAALSLGLWSLQLNRQVNELGGQKQSGDLLLAEVQKLRDPTERGAAIARLTEIAEARHATDSATQAGPDGSSGSVAEEPDDAPTLEYWSRPTDAALVETALRPLDYSITQRESTSPGTPTNQVSYGAVDIEDVKRVTLALIAAGVRIKRVKPFQDSELAGKNLIQILGVPRLSAALPLPVDSIQVLGGYRRTAGPIWNAMTVVVTGNFGSLREAVTDAESTRSKGYDAAVYFRNRTWRTAIRFPTRDSARLALPSIRAAIPRPTAYLAIWNPWCPDPTQEAEYIACKPADPEQIVH